MNYETEIKNLKNSVAILEFELKKLHTKMENQERQFDHKIDSLNCRSHTPTSMDFGPDLIYSEEKIVLPYPELNKNPQYIHKITPPPSPQKRRRRRRTPP